MPVLRQRTFWVTALIVIVASIAGCATPEESRTQDDAPTETILRPDDIIWGPGPDSLPSGARLAVLSGDPIDSGPLTMRAEIPANYAIPPHTHAATEHVTVLSGVAHIGMGKTFDQASATQLSAGGFFAIPPGHEHYFFTTTEPVMIQIQSTGPWNIAYVDPADDPRSQATG